MKLETKKMMTLAQRRRRRKRKRRKNSLKSDENDSRTFPILMIVIDMLILTMMTNSLSAHMEVKITMVGKVKAIVQMEMEVRAKKVVGEVNAVSKALILRKS